MNKYRFNQGHLYAWNSEANAYVHVLVAPPGYTKSEAIDMYLNSDD